VKTPYCVHVWCGYCGDELWAGLSNKEKAELIAQGKADDLECSDCIIKHVSLNRRLAGKEGG
jgi:hypothetical protein